MADIEDDISEEETVSSSPAIDGASAAAILLMLLEEDVAASIMGDLAPAEIKLIGSAMFRSAEASEAQVEAALDHFVQRSRRVSALAVDAEPRIRNVITRALGNVRADNILESIAPQSSAETLEMLRWMDVGVISRILSSEHPQVAALVLAVLTPDAAATAVESLSADLQADLLHRAARLTSVNADAIADLEALLGRYDDVQKATPRMKLGGKSEIAKIFNSMSKPGGERALKAVKKWDKVLGQAIEDEMFIFENLLDLDAKSLGTVLRTVDAQVLTLALKGASETLLEKSLGSMSARAAQSIRDEMSEMAPVKRTEVEEAQRAVVTVARQLAEEGGVQLGGRGDDYV